MTSTPEQRVAAAKAKYTEPWWDSSDLKVLALGQLREDILLIPFDRFHEAVEHAAGRPVWTHEFVDPQRLIDEIEGRRPMGTFADSLALLDPAKTVVAVVGTPTPATVRQKDER